MTIRQTQHLLAYHGLYKGAVDGLWGPITEQAVRKFQSAFGLEVDGIVGVATEEALRHSITYGLPEADADTVDSWWDEIEYFTREELRCKCGGRYCDGFPAEPQELAVRLADRARRHFGRPAHNVSFLRCPEWNRLQGGVTNSQHMYGEAMDIRIDGVTASELCAFFKAQPEVRYTYEINGTNVHFDIQPVGR
jgi:peptidoglycan hydrolase-like protein with peptidoglycan-binding domain